LGSYHFKENIKSNGFEAESAWVQKQNMNGMGEYHELEVCNPTAIKTIYGRIRPSCDSMKPGCMPI